MRRWILALAIALPAAAAAANTLTIALRTAAIKAKPKFLSDTVGTAKLGDTVTPISESQGFYRVSLRGSEGWIHSSAVSSKRSKLMSGDTAGRSVSADETTLAASGFDEKVEKAYKEKHPDTTKAFAHVEAMEDAKVSESEALRFLKDGGLGGAQ
jgi:hypothetical protein